MISRLRKTETEELHVTYCYVTMSPQRQWLKAQFLQSGSEAWLSWGLHWGISGGTSLRLDRRRIPFRTHSGCWQNSVPYSRAAERRNEEFSSLLGVRWRPFQAGGRGPLCAPRTTFISLSHEVPSRPLLPHCPRERDPARLALWSQVR